MVHSVAALWRCLLIKVVFKFTETSKTKSLVLPSPNSKTGKAVGQVVCVCVCGCVPAKWSRKAGSGLGVAVLACSRLSVAPLVWSAAPEPCSHSSSPPSTALCRLCSCTHVHAKRFFILMRHYTMGVHDDSFWTIRRKENNLFSRLIHAHNLRKMLHVINLSVMTIYRGARYWHGIPAGKMTKVFRCFRVWSALKSENCYFYKWESEITNAHQWFCSSQTLHSYGLI